MDLHLEGKVVFVTGGFKGIGKGIALQLAREGAVPVVLNRKDGVEDEFRAEISEITKTFEMYYIDLNDTDAIKPIVEEVYKKYGHIDGVVNNAGRNDNLELETTSWQDFEKSLHGNLTHYFELVHETCPYLKESKGSIVNIASKVALTGQGKTTAYAAAKGAILGLTREWAAALSTTPCVSTPSSSPRPGRRCMPTGSRPSVTRRPSRSVCPSSRTASRWSTV